MKKYKAICMLSVILLSMVLLSCAKPKPKTPIALSFDKNEAYFCSSVPLYPIGGEALAGADVYENASIVISASKKVKLRLTISIEGEQTEYRGVSMLVEDREIVALCDKTVLYESAEPELEKQLNIKIYVENNAPIALKGIEIKFYFVLSYEE